MNIIYSDHAKKRIKQRGMEEWDVEHILKYPKQIRKSIDNTKEAIGETKNRTIKIVFIELESYIKVITIIFL